MGLNSTSRRIQRFEQRRARRRRKVALVVAFALLALALAAGVVLAIVSSLNSDESNNSPAARPTIDVTLTDYQFIAPVEVPSGDLRFNLRNGGSETHNFGIRGRGISTDIRSGDSGSFEIDDLPPGTYTMYCDIDDHEARGMVADLVVTPNTAPPVTTGEP
jgi:plastocyanin